MIDKIAQEFPDAIARELPRANLEPREKLRERCARALRGAVAAAKDDPVAEEAWQTDSTRLGWHLLSASVVPSVVTGVVAGLGYKVMTGETAESLATGAVAATAMGGVVLFSAAVLAGGGVRRARDALHDLVDALLPRNPEVWELLEQDARHRERDVPLSNRMEKTLSRIIASSGLGRQKSPTEPARKEFLCRWDGPEREAVRKALESCRKALDELPFPPDWTASTCLIDQVQELLASFPRTTAEALSASNPSADAYEDQLERGKRLFHALVCCAAVAGVLDDSLGLEATPVPKAA